MKEPIAIIHKAIEKIKLPFLLTLLTLVIQIKTNAKNYNYGAIKKRHLYHNAFQKNDSLLLTKQNLFKRTPQKTLFKQSKAFIPCSMQASYSDNTLLMLRICRIRDHTYPYQPEFTVALLVHNTLNENDENYPKAYYSPIDNYLYSFSIKWPGYSFYTFNRPDYEECRKIDKKIVTSLEYDFYATDSTFSFFVTDSSAFYHWQSKSLTPQKKDDWRATKAYTTRKVNMEYPPRKKSPFYKNKELLHKTIKDTAILSGAFKVIHQSGNDFMVNLQSGKIYWLGVKHIRELGQISILEHYPLLLNQKLFIEDRDNNEIIFFAPVLWNRKKPKFPRPNIKVMTEEEMKKKFKYVIETALDAPY